MKKLLSLAFPAFLFCLCSYGQNMGFRTTDIGGEFQWYPRGTIYNLHVAFNAKLNHSFQLRLGYNHVPAYNVIVKNFYASFFPFDVDQTEQGKGWGGGIGYRYYFKPFPHKFFIGARADIWIMKIDIDNASLGPNYKNGNMLILQPALEAGYTFVINDVLYITPYAAAGFQTDLSKSPFAHYGNGFTPTAGISAGIRF